MYTCQPRKNRIQIDSDIGEERSMVLYKLIDFTSLIFARIKRCIVLEQGLYLYSPSKIILRYLIYSVIGYQDK